MGLQLLAKLGGKDGQQLGEDGIGRLLLDLALPYHVDGPAGLLERAPVALVAIFGSPALRASLALDSCILCAGATLHISTNMEMAMEQVNVVAAVIVRDNSVLATQRGYGEFKDGWEFPGGKVEQGESDQEALVREIREELNAEIVVDDYLCKTEHDYDNFHLSMTCYICTLGNNHIDLLEHEDAKWLDSDTVDSVNWLPADIAVVDAIKKTVFDN